ncbi:acetyl-coenzyme A synthetase N-terminal domain-containing protein [Rhodococcus opacus]|uniref:acetyl-coenzyme A synthetase N-terminal domain-containing protein n=1 Tax=Rhodococcus opacus TaxID=37919 RepID=UPI0026C8FC6F
MEGEVEASRIDWDAPWDVVFEEQAGPYSRWFPGARLNTSANCLDRHVDAGAGERPTLVWDSAMTGEQITFTYRQLRDRVAKVAGPWQPRGCVVLTAW